MARKFDNDQKNAINIDINAVVSAGAGSGKTTVLSERFLDLINRRNCNVDEILTLTFTKKATVEMSDRIFKVLQKKSPEQAANFHKNNIKTFDSYCSNIAKAGARYFGISPDFTQDKEAIMNQASTLALPFILKHRENPAIRQLVTSNNYADIANNIFVYPITSISTIVSPIDFKQCIKNQIAELTEIWNKNVKSVSQIYNSMAKDIEDFSGNTKSATWVKISEGMNKISAPVETFVNDEMIYSGNIKEVLEYGTIVKSLAALPKPGNLKGLDIYRDGCDEIRKINELLISICNYFDIFKYLDCLIPLMEEFQDKINDFKRQTGVLSFQDIADIALQTLIQFPEIRQLEKEKFQAIMVDEFQDNNSMQRDLLFLIAENLERKEKSVPSADELCPEKLFFVGDEKQSIYMFRGADVSVFRSLSKEFPKGNLSMTTNYRSNPALISAFNTIFGGFSYPSFPKALNNGETENPSVFYSEAQKEILEKQDEEIPEFEAVYQEVTIQKDTVEELKSKSEEEVKKVFEPKTHFALYDSEQEAEDNQLTNTHAEAEWIARKIKEILSTKTKKVRVTKNDEEQIIDVPVSPNDIAILLRKVKNQSIFEQALLRHGIPYNTVSTTGVFSDGPVNDIISFLRIIVYKKDSMSYAQILRSPFVNLSTNEANGILVESLEPFAAEGKSLAEKSKKRYERARKLYSEIAEFTRKNTISKTISKLWYETGYFYETIWNENVAMYNKLYDMLFALAIQAEQNCKSLASFVDGMRQYVDDSQKIENLEIPVEQSDGVQIMTIHASKGLEFEYVFVSQLEKKFKKQANNSPVFASKKYGISLCIPSEHSGTKDNYFFTKAKNENQCREIAEERRILYVALTRAKTELYLTNGKYTPAKEPFEYVPGTSKNPECLFNLLEPVVEHYKTAAEEDSNIQIPFDIEQITPFNRNETSDNIKRKNTLESKIQLLNEIESKNLYKNSGVYETEVVESIYTSPSKLHTEEIDSDKAIILSDEGNVPYQKINDIVLSTVPESKYEDENPEPRFGFNNFGTIAHAFLESAITGEKPAFSLKELLGLENNSKKINCVMEICQEMKEKFLETDLGKEAVKSKWHRAEFPFRSRIGNKIIKGNVDLVFMDEDGTYTVIDYKTNSSVKPEIYYEQLACYRQAVSQIVNVPEEKVRCILYYLRFGKAVDVSTECSKVILEDIIN